MTQSKRYRRNQWFSMIGFTLVSAATATGQSLAPETAPQKLSPYMNSIPPSNNFLCVGLGAEVRLKHPDRAPHTKLAMQDGVVLFSGAAPQLGLNFELRAGALTYRNQMSTLGSPEPSPQVGTAGTLMQRGADFFLPWSEARWHPGEDITWQGHREDPHWIEGLAYWKFNADGISVDSPPNCEPLSPAPHNPSIDQVFNGVHWNLESAINLQLARGIYQASHIRAGWRGDELGLCPYEFREPWFQARARDPVFNVQLPNPSDSQNNLHLGGTYYPNYLNIYAYQHLELDGGRLEFDFERSATWPRQPTDLGANKLREHGAITGATMASEIHDENGNRVVFDRVPDYGWETDYKAPHASHRHILTGVNADPSFESLPAGYNPPTNAWRLPHKRLRTVHLQEADNGGEPDWIVAFVFEHPESDHIGDAETTDSTKWRSLYSYLPQAEWSFGRLPELDDETTLLTVQAYRRENLTAETGQEFNGAPFQDDYSVWGNSLFDPNFEAPTDNQRVNAAPLCTGTGCTDAPHPGSDPTGDTTDKDDPNGPCPGLCGVDDDNDGLIDEDSNGFQAYLDVDNETDCHTCQQRIFANDGIYGPLDPCWTATGIPKQSYQPNTNYTCKNPMYWKGVLDEHMEWVAEVENGFGCDQRLDPLAGLDDDEDGLVDEDGDDDPLLVDLRLLDDNTDDKKFDGCASGRFPYLPAATKFGSDATRATLPGNSTASMCRPLLGSDAQSDPWTYQVQYVYARSDPYWLLRKRLPDGTTTSRNKPAYYYYPPFTEPFQDANGNGVWDSGEQYEDYNRDLHFTTFGATDPHVHPDCLPNPDFRGPQGSDIGGTQLDGVPPGSIHLIKRIVRVRPEHDQPTQVIERTWLYRYDDLGFLKAVFDPASIQAIMDADSSIAEPDDILKLADTADVGGKPLIFYASQWYTYYNPYVTYESAPNQCYDKAPFVGGCVPGFGVRADNPMDYWPPNACDGQTLWDQTYAYHQEYHVDPDCSNLMNQDCGWCFARYGCRDACKRWDTWDSAVCDCPTGVAADETALRQMGIPDAQPRFRKYMVKTARVRGSDSQMHLYRFDYLGAASSVYTGTDRLTSYADPHNITIVDEIVPQEPNELTETERSDFYIYEDDFRLSLDPADGTTRPSSAYAEASAVTPTTHYLYEPAKVKTRRVVVMNYYGIAISDRLMLTPGFQGDTTRLLNDESYELVNERGQIKHFYDESWVAGLRKRGADYVKTAGRVATELFGGQGGWYSVLAGIAKGSGGGNVYDQQCKTPEVLDEVPIQRVKPDQLTVTRATKHFTRTLDPTVTCSATPDNEACVADMPLVEARYMRPIDYTQAGTFIDEANTIGAGTTADGCTCTDNDSDGVCDNDPTLSGIDLTKQDPVVVQSIYGETPAEGDGAISVMYHYEFLDEGANGNPSDDPQQRLTWKWRWQEKVSPACGGADHTQLEISFFDQNGRLRFVGRGAGTATGTPPTPEEPFYVTYYGYDEYGRLAVQVEDVDLSDITSAENLAYADDLDSYWTGSGSTTKIQDALARQPAATTASPAAFYTTINRYNDAGMLVSTQVGTASGAVDVAGGSGSTVTYNLDASGAPEWIDAKRTDFAFISNRKITYTEDNHTQVAWSDDYDYFIEYQDVDVSDPTKVYGTTTVRMLDKGGRLVEERVIGWNSARGSDDTSLSMYDKIDDFGWGISLADYDHDGAIADWSFQNNLPDVLVDANCDSNDGNYPDCNNDGHADFGKSGVLPALPTDAQGTELPWPPDAEHQIVTLSRKFNRYDQHSTVKPTSEIVMNGFSLKPPDPDHPNDPFDPTWERERVERKTLYDLEDRVAQTIAPDGTVSRFLFDPKRRPTKIFKGSNDGCHDWFPATTISGATEETDDMMLTEHMFYNDGDDACENSLTNDHDVCLLESNPNFPNNAGKLVRKRRYSASAESCATAYEPDTPSRDKRYIYDWRGRPVIVEELAIGYDKVGSTSSMENPKFISTTTTVYTSLDQPALTATWPEDGAPDVETIEGWEDVWRPDSADGIARFILTQGPLTLSQTNYDDRGRPYEQRTYDVDDATGATYLFTRTYRDDLDRVIGEVSPSGFVETEYDSLGRIVRESMWSAEDSTNPGSPATDGVELTRTVYVYDGVGNVVEQIFFDRKDMNDTTSGHELADNNNAPNSNAIATYTCNWYDEANRLSATANYGSNSDDYFTHETPVSCSQSAPPVWNGSDNHYEIANVSLTNDAIVSQFGYDTIGRRIWSRDGEGRVTRTWYDLLGRTILKAENWHDPDGNAGPGGTDLTPGHNGAIRYTAYHYTRGGLLDITMAIIPDTPDANITPDLIDWKEVAAQDYAAGDGISITGSPAIQATRYVYHVDDGGAPVANVVAEITSEGGALGADMGFLPSLVSEIHYPDPSSGQPSNADEQKVQFKYTLGGQIAARVDQRGVELRYEYGTPATAPGSSALAAVQADLGGLYPGQTVFGDNAGGATRLVFTRDARDLVADASSYAGSTLQNKVLFQYDGYGNLLQEEARPLGNPNTNHDKTTGYEWDTSGVNRNRLAKLFSPSGREFRYGYGPADSPSDKTSRMMEITKYNAPPGYPFFVYSRESTGGGDTYKRSWAGAQINFNNADSKLDRFGRTAELNVAYVSSAMDYQYGYDGDSNRIYERIHQPDSDNTNSYRYVYDELNRLVSAKRGTLDTDNKNFTTAPSSGTQWNLDVLGNWDGPPSGDDVFDFTSTSTEPVYDDSSDSVVVDSRMDNVYDPQNRLVGTGRGDGMDVVYTYDAAGNMIGRRVEDPTTYPPSVISSTTYDYDAWNRLAKVVRSGPANQVVYNYDALGRRNRKRINGLDGINTAIIGDFFYYDGNRPILQRSGVTGGSGPGGGGGGGSSKIIAGASETSGGNSTARLASDSGTANAATPDDPKSELRATLVTWGPKYEWVWGFDYIDELVGLYYESYPDEDMFPILQDANYNVVGVYDVGGDYMETYYRYDPYGKLTYATGETGVERNPDNYTEEPYNVHQFQGLMYDRETGLYYARGRYYDPEIGRFVSQDPNGQTLVLIDALARNGESMAAMAGLDVGGQYGDGMNLYEFVGGRPAGRLDPSGETISEYFYSMAGAFFGQMNSAMTLPVNNNERQLLLTAAGLNLIRTGMRGAFILAAAPAAAAIRRGFRLLATKRWRFGPTVRKISKWLSTKNVGLQYLQYLFFKRQIYRRLVRSTAMPLMGAGYLKSLVPDPIWYSSERLQDMGTGFLDLPAGSGAADKFARPLIAFGTGYIMGALESTMLLTDNDMSAFYP